MPAQYAIKDLERLSGIKAHTLRIWELRYGILKPERSGTNIRCYSSNDLKRILNISLLNNNGYKISKIAAFLDEEIVSHAQTILNTYGKESDQIDNLVLCMVEMDEPKFEQTICNCIKHFGFENTMERVIFPFLQHTGSLWQIGIINCAQEHFISQLIKQKIIAAIDVLAVQPATICKTFLLYLPDKELHEMGLLYCRYLVKARGHKCVYLGQAVPLCDLLEVSACVAPHVVVSTFTTPLEDVTLQNYVNHIASHFVQSKLIFSGRLFYTEHEPVTLPNNVILFQTFDQFKNMLCF